MPTACCRQVRKEGNNRCHHFYLYRPAYWILVLPLEYEANQAKPRAGDEIQPNLEAPPAAFPSVQTRHFSIRVRGRVHMDSLLPVSNGTNLQDDNDDDEALALPSRLIIYTQHDYIQHRGLNNKLDLIRFILELVTSGASYSFFIITQALATSQLNSSCKQEYHPPRLQPGSLPDSSCTKASTLQRSIFPWERILAHELSSFSISSGRESFSYIFLRTATTTPTTPVLQLSWQKHAMIHKLIKI